MQVKLALHFIALNGLHIALQGSSAPEQHSGLPALWAQALWTQHSGGSCRLMVPDCRPVACVYYTVLLMLLF